MLDLEFSPFPILHTQRLTLRQVQIEDTNEVFMMRSDPDIMKYIPRPIARSKADAAKAIRVMNRSLAKAESINWAITYKGEPTLIGIIGFVRLSKQDHRGEIGYTLDKAHHRKGIIGEAIKIVIAYGFDKLKFHTIEGVIDPDNSASEKLLVRNGFTKEAHFRENVYHDGKWFDSVHYTLFRG
jgi:ribosomal-protein-alanine N-acetyltransferase